MRDKAKLEERIKRYEELVARVKAGTLRMRMEPYGLPTTEAIRLLEQGIRRDKAKLLNFSWASTRACQHPANNVVPLRVIKG
jgi:hypothetical protein